MITGATLDHVAVAAERWEDVWPRYAGELGGRWISGGEASGFAAHQMRFANGGKLELIRPHRPEQNDFLRRFLDRSGPGPHHLTFKVPDIVAALEESERSGYRPVNLNLDDPEWKEAFLHPKDAPGVVVQLAEAAGNWSSAPPLGYPPATHDTAATLDRVVHAVADLDEGLALFAALLGGEEVGRGDGWVELAWATPIHVRLVTTETAWIGDRRGRVHHLAFTCPWLDDQARTVEPDDNLGTRLLMFPG